MRSKRIIYMFFICFTLGLVILANCCSSQACVGNVFTAHVVRVIDGDTISVRDMAGGVHRIRLAMIDAPEKAQPYGEEATKSLEEFLQGRIVRLKIKCIDKYNREVAFVHCDDKDVSAEMLRQGMAMHYHIKFEDCALYDSIQKQAKKEKLGLWQSENIETPWNYRHRQKMMQEEGARTC